MASGNNPTWWSLLAYTCLLTCFVLWNLQWKKKMASGIWDYSGAFIANWVNECSHNLIVHKSHNPHRILLNYSNRAYTYWQNTHWFVVWIIKSWLIGVQIIKVLCTTNNRAIQPVFCYVLPTLHAEKNMWN